MELRPFFDKKITQRKTFALWYRTTRNLKVSAGPLAHTFASLLAPLTHLLASLVRSTALIRSLAHSLIPELVGKRFLPMDFIQF